VTRIYLGAAAAIVVIATVIITLVVLGEPTEAQAGALVALVIAQVYTFGVLFLAASVRKGDSNNFIPAILATIPILIVGIIVLATSLDPTVAVILQVIGWAIALIAFLVSFAVNRAEASQAESAPGKPDFNARPGKG
jgi:hypothetical protein